MMNLPEGGGPMQWMRNVLHLLKGMWSIVHGVGVALIGFLAVFGLLFLKYWEAIYDLLLSFPGFLYRITNQAIYYIEQTAYYLQQVAGFFEGPFAPYAAFINTFLPLQEAVELLVFIGAFALTALIVRLIFKLSIIWR